jgi:hypothetical protein
MHVVSDKDVLLWNWLDVSLWFGHCDLIRSSTNVDQSVRDYLEDNETRGSDLLNDNVTHQMLGITEPFEIKEYCLRLSQLKMRGFREKARIEGERRKEEQGLENYKRKRKIVELIEEPEKEEKEEKEQEKMVALLTSLEEEGFEQNVKDADEQDRMKDAGYGKWWNYETRQTADYKSVTEKMGFTWREIGYREKLARADESEEDQTKEQLEAEVKSLEDGTYVHENVWFIWTSLDFGVTWTNSGEH